MNDLLMDKTLENNLYESVLAEDLESATDIILQGANPNKIICHGKTCLGEAAIIGNIEIVKLLIESSQYQCKATANNSCPKKRLIKSHKRKLRQDRDSRQSEIAAKCKNLNERTIKDCFVSPEGTISISRDTLNDRNQGYFIYIHSDGSSSDESRVPALKSALSPLSLTPSPNGELEWDEDIVNVAPTTSEDETWSSMYKWYASILECTGAALASAAVVTNGIDQQDAFMRTALHYAAEQGHSGIVKLLLEAGCKLDITAGDGLTPLHVAVIRNHGDIVKMLLNFGSHVNYKTYEKNTALHFAASRGYLDLVKILVNNGANLEARDTSERTALYLASGRGHEDVVKYLISSGANVNGEEIHGYTPLCEAVWQRCGSAVQVLLASGARITYSHKLLHNAIIQRQEDIVRMLANVGGGINLHDDNGDTPLLLAVRLSQPNIVRILLEKGTNVNSCNSITGANPLHIAVENIENPDDFEDLLLCLLAHRIDMNSTALTGDTALNRALLLHMDDAARLLIRYGADVNASDFHSYGLDNLAIASRRRSPFLANMLLKAGHSRPCPDTRADSPRPGGSETLTWLHEACKEPLNLTDLCRIRIRGMCKDKPLFMYLESLPLPKSTKRFLTLELL